MFQSHFYKTGEMWLPIIHVHHHLWLWQQWLCNPMPCLIRIAWLWILPLKYEVIPEKWVGMVWESLSACVRLPRLGGAGSRSGASAQHCGPAISVKCVHWDNLGRVPLHTQRSTQCLDIHFHTMFFFKNCLIWSLSPTKYYIYNRHSCLKLSRKRSVLHFKLIT